MSKRNWCPHGIGCATRTVIKCCNQCGYTFIICEAHLKCMKQPGVCRSCAEKAVQAEHIETPGEVPTGNITETSDALKLVLEKVQRLENENASLRSENERLHAENRELKLPPAQQSFIPSYEEWRKQQRALDAKCSFLDAIGGMRFAPGVSDGEKSG